MNKRIYLSSPTMDGSEQHFIQKAFDENWVAPVGPNIDQFESEIKRYVNSENAVSLSSGTAAIHMALKAAGVEAGDLVFCSTFTFAASCNPILYLGATPVFVDSERDSWNMCPLALMKAFIESEKLPKAVVVVNLYGQSADMDQIKKICDHYGVPIIEDAAESLGATYKDKYSGTIGEYGIYSFNGNKIITTSSGGMLVTNNSEGAAKVKKWSTQSREPVPYYQHEEIGYNYRMSNVLAGIGIAQLRLLDLRITQKQEIYKMYNDKFAHIKDIKMMPICDYGTPNYWLSCMTLSSKSNVSPSEIIQVLEENNIEARHLWKPMHLQPAFSKYPFYTILKRKSVAEDLFSRGVCLPSDVKMSPYEQLGVIKIIKNALGEQ